LAELVKQLTKQLIGVAGMELVEKLTKPLVGVAGMELIDQLAKLRQLIGLVGPNKMAGRAKVVDHSTKLRQLVGLVGPNKRAGRAKVVDQLANLRQLVRLDKVARRAKLVDQLANLLDQRVGGTGRISLPRVVGLNGLNGYERQSLLLVQRVLRLNLAHRNPRRCSQRRSGYRGGSPSPQPRSGYLHHVVTWLDFHGMPSLLAAVTGACSVRLR
jgi:hypothetical protein